MFNRRKIPPAPMTWCKGTCHFGPDGYCVKCTKHAGVPKPTPEPTPKEIADAKRALKKMISSHPNKIENGPPRVVPGPPAKPRPKIAGVPISPPGVLGSQGVVGPPGAVGNPGAQLPPIPQTLMGNYMAATGATGPMGVKIAGFTMTDTGAYITDKDGNVFFSEEIFKDLMHRVTEMEALIAKRDLEFMLDRAEGQKTTLR